ncbi:MAG: hypothetical protein AAGU03_00365 [Anaerolineaceae bacterium]
MLNSDTMPTTFRHDPKLYRSRVYGEGMVSLFALAFCIYKYITTLTSIRILWVLVGIVCIYSFYRLLISRSTPELITITPERVRFEGAGKTREFLISDLSEFLVKEFRIQATQFIRIKDKSGKKSKYWIELKVYSDQKILEEQLLKVEERIHPDEMKAMIKSHNKQFQNKKVSDVSKRKK